MKRLLIAVSFFASFSSAAHQDYAIEYSNKVIDFMQNTKLMKPVQKIDLPKPDLKNAPVYVKDFYEMNPIQKQNIKASIKIGNKYQYHTAKPVESSSDKRLGYQLAAISWIESRACKDTGKGKKNHHAYGCFQILYNTAKTRTPEMSGASSKRLLVSRLETLQGGSDYALQELEYWLSYHKGDMKKALASYNAGFSYSSREAKTYSKMVMNTASLIEKHF
ncbi:hypothetical protein POP12_016 [Pectobacterium phage POP12]|nr:hypothetical protein POP12_016 [Pectobacterium phage POP12]